MREIGDKRRQHTRDRRQKTDNKQETRERSEEIGKVIQLIVRQDT